MTPEKKSELGALLRMIAFEVGVYIVGRFIMRAGGYKPQARWAKIIDEMVL